MTQVTFKVENAGTYADIVRSKLPFSRLENGVIIIHSLLDENESLNEHLVWLWSTVKHERRVLKSAVSNGGRITCECTAPKGRVHLLPNGAEMLHLLGVELILEVK